jgi:SAM-dependent methyltransferase/uncharacterized protein YbaR (Trm112 family)
VYLHHFDSLRPVCPVCRTPRGKDHPLRIGQVAKEEQGEILEGSLICTNVACQREHPILDGIPVIVTDGSSWLANQIFSVFRRDDLSDFTLSMLGDLSGNQSALDRERSNNSIYAHSHWAPAEPSYLQLLEALNPLLPSEPQGIWLDAGCSLGRGVFELARRTRHLTVGVDLNFSMLRLAQSIRRKARVSYELRRVGLVYDRIDYPLPFYPLAETSFWCADVAAMPFPDACFDGAIALNMLDCVASPLGLLVEAGRLLKPGAPAVFSTPFDWSVGASTPAAWLGGHSQRSSPGMGSSVEFFRAILPQVDTGLQLAAELDGLTWRLRTNERSITEYNVYAARLNRC